MGNLNSSALHEYRVSQTSIAWQQPDQSAIEQVEQRVIKQLLQALIYEDIVQVFEHDGTFEIQATDQQQAVIYRAYGQRYLSFGLIRFNHAPVIRIDARGVSQLARLNGVLNEIVRAIPNAQECEDFLMEIKRTFMHDVQSISYKQAYPLPASQYCYDQLETYLMDGHPYHPCYKSRVGFSLLDNAKYGVEYAEPIHLVWLAVHHSLVKRQTSISASEDHTKIAQLSPKDRAEFQATLIQKTESPDEFIWLPVHPWQWENTIIPIFFEELSAGQLIYLGRGETAYVAQQSLRTLTNLKQPEQPYIKLSMSLTNTSSSRILATHAAMNGPLITDWLQALMDQSPIAQALDFAILRETHATALDFTQLPSSHAQQAYGTIGSLWRESVHCYLREGEDAMPLNGVGHLQLNGQLLIQPWLDQYGAEQWLEQFLSVTIQPILFFLYAEGIGTESHGQNMILVHRNGWPTRIILKDFHDGVRFSPQHLTHPDQFPTLHALPKEHAKANRMSFIETEDVNLVRDFSCACLFFVALSDIAISLHQQLNLDERIFWSKVAGVIHTFQRQYPEHQSRYEIFDVFAKEYCIESLTKRRLFGDAAIQLKQVQNPLYRFRVWQAKEQTA